MGTRSTQTCFFVVFVIPILWGQKVAGGLLVLTMKSHRLEIDELCIDFMNVHQSESKLTECKFSVQMS